MNPTTGEESASQVVEEFWGVELTKNKKTAKWDAEDEEEAAMCISNNLELRQACLGPGAVEGERNIVQITVDDGTGKTSTFSILSLRAGLAEQTTLFLNLQPPVIFKLVEGSGPVNIVGQTTETLDSFDDSDDDDSENDEQIVSLEKKPLSMPQKRPASSTKPPAAKVAKKENMDMSTEADDDEDDDDEDDDDGEDEEEEGDDDESEEEEEEEKPKPVIPKKAQINGKPKTPLKEKAIKLNTSKTPQPVQKGKFQQKGSSSVPPKSAPDKKKTAGKGFDINEIKKKLSKMNVPKKLEKFNNFVSNSFKIKDDAVKKELWQHVQKSSS